MYLYEIVSRSKGTVSRDVLCVVRKRSGSVSDMCIRQKDGGQNNDSADVALRTGKDFLELMLKWWQIKAIWEKNYTCNRQIAQSHNCFKYGKEDARHKIFKYCGVRNTGFALLRTWKEMQAKEIWKSKLQNKEIWYVTSEYVNVMMRTKEKKEKEIQIRMLHKYCLA